MLWYAQGQISILLSSITSRNQSNPKLEHRVDVKNVLKHLKRNKEMFLFYEGDFEL